MMNEAEKRLIEVTALKHVYDFCQGQISYRQNDIEYDERVIRDGLEEDPDYNTTYYEESIENSKATIEAYKAIQKALLKMM